MDFDKLTKAEKLKYWEDTNQAISASLSSCGELISASLQEDIRRYLEHNELGLAVELLVDTAINEHLPIEKSIKASILRILNAMDYAKDEPERYRTYVNWASESS